MFCHRFVCSRRRCRDGVHEKRLQGAKGGRGPQKTGEVNEEHAGILHADRLGVERLVLIELSIVLYARRRFIKIIYVPRRIYRFKVVSLTIIIYELRRVYCCTTAL